jgi:hypothetical protein
VKRILEFLMRPATNGIAVGVVLSVFFISIQGPARCNDGWRSPSIGVRGACSHHRGVGPSFLMLELLLSAFVGYWVYAARNEPLENRRQAELRMRQEGFDAELKATAHANGVACPLCGFPLLLRRAYRGKNKGGYFMGCSRYPHCNGTRNLTLEEVQQTPKRRSQERQPSI